MNTEFLQITAKYMVEPPKGILAIDESTETCTKRFTVLNIESTEETRRAYRELLITAPDIEKYVSGMIMVDETLHQSTKDGKKFLDIFKEKGMLVGIKVDKGLVEFPGHPGEKITEGLDGLSERLTEYKQMGAVFAKWRSAYTITEETPTDECIKENNQRLARYAKLCQEAGIVPIVEPEVLMDGSHDIEKCYQIISKILQDLFRELEHEDVFLPGLILKTGMVISGKGASAQATSKEIAEWTIKCLTEHVPRNIGGVVFLSGGQDEKSATINLREMHRQDLLPWPLTFSYGRAIQNPALHIWAKDRTQIKEAQDALLELARADSAASVGKDID